MATLKSPPPTHGNGRISQLLPTVKCSSCNASVALTDLGEHVCAAANAAPPKTPSSLLPARLQGLVSRSRNSVRNSTRNSSQLTPSSPRTPTSKQQPPSRTGTPSIQTPQPSRQQSPAPLQPPSSPQPNAAQLSPGWNQSRVPSPLSGTGGSLNAGSGRANGQPTLQERMRTASTSLREPPRPFAQRERTMSAGRNDLPPPRPQPQHPPPPSPNLRNRTPSNSSRGSVASQPRPSFDSRPSADSRRPSVDQRPILDTRSPVPPPDRRPSFDTGIRPPPRQGSHAIGAPPPSSSPPLPLPGSMPFPQSAPLPELAPPRSPVPALEPDTKIGGEAGMAGVGRRGFAAAARAAMFANVVGHSAGGGLADVDPMSIGVRRDNAPRFLDINAAIKAHAQSGTTPPLSPSGYSPHSPGPRSPMSPNPSVLSSHSSVLTAQPNGFGPVGTASRTPSPASTVTIDASKAPFFEKYKDHLPTVDTTPNPYDKDDSNLSPLSPSSGSDYEGGLAYADSTDDEEDNAVITPMSPPQETTVLAPAALVDEKVTATKPKANQVRFPSVDEKLKSTLKRSPSASSVSSGSDSGSGMMYGSLGSSQVPTGRERSNSATSAASGSNYSHSTAKSTHALDRAMETLFEEGSSSTGVKSKTGRSNTIPGLEPLSPEHKPPKLPTRSLTGPSHVTFSEAKARKRKECVRCERVIEDGRWIQTDAGGVLCERCWKNMYLPKCRRCHLPIEKHAVSSSDGQLKGKYHRECFTCYECHKPFPDKEFYVHDGKPLCAYHYHAANKSLCASCGEPIEGPCAVSHTGDRYHPEHLRCEYPGCQEALDEYWEADGKMMCERHAEIVEGFHNSQDDEGAWAAESKAQKRITRFIDLAGIPDDEEEEENLR